MTRSPSASRTYSRFGDLKNSILSTVPPAVSVSTTRHPRTIKLLSHWPLARPSAAAAGSRAKLPRSTNRCPHLKSSVGQNSYRTLSFVRPPSVVSARVGRSFGVFVARKRVQSTFSSSSAVTRTIKVSRYGHLLQARAHSTSPSFASSINSIEQKKRCLWYRWNSTFALASCDDVVVAVAKAFGVLIIQKQKIKRKKQKKNRRNMWLLRSTLTTPISSARHQ